MTTVSAGRPRLAPVSDRWADWCRHHPRAARRLRPAVVAAGALIVVVAVMALVGVVHAVGLEHRLQVLDTTTQQVELDVKARQLGDAQIRLADLEAELTSVNATLDDSADLRLLELIPVARQNLQAVRTSVHAALDLVAAGDQVANAAAPLEGADGTLQLTLHNGQLPTSTIAAVQQAAQGAVTAVPSAPHPPSGLFLLGRVRSGEDRVWAQVVKRRKQLATLAAGLQVLNDVTGADGPRRYMIAVANNAEMRGAGGMILSYGILNADHGKVSLGRFGPIAQLALRNPAPAAFPADFDQQFGYLHPNQYFQEATVLPDFTVDGPVIESMFTKATGLPVNGVIQVDPYVLAAILSATGPIHDPALGTVSATNVVPLTLNEAYLAIGNRTLRQDYLGQAGREAFAALTGHQPHLTQLASAMTHVVKDRDLLVHSTNPTTQQNIGVLGMDGALPGAGQDFAQLDVENFGANKLDYYLESGLAVAATRPSDGSPGDATVTIGLINTAPYSTASQYVFGPGPDVGDPPSEYHGIVNLYLPAGTRLTGAHASDAATEPQDVSQDGRAVITFAVTIPSKAEAAVVLHLVLPERGLGPEHFVIVPTPRVQPTITSVHVTP